MQNITYPIPGYSVLGVTHVITLYSDKSGDEPPHGIIMIRYSEPEHNHCYKTPPFFNFPVVYVELEDRKKGFGTLLVKMGNALAQHIFVNDQALRAEVHPRHLSKRALYTVMYYPVSEKDEECYAYFQRMVLFSASLGFEASNADVAFFGADTETEVAFHFRIDVS